jgi:aspartate/tyrosine/aromatic aminotransferase
VRLLFIAVFPSFESWLMVGSKDEKTRVFSQLKIITRAMISSPPIHAAHLVIEILSHKSLREEWFRETKLMADRIKSMRRISSHYILTYKEHN